MEKTIRQALIDEIQYPLSVGFIDNKLCARGLDPRTVINLSKDGKSVLESKEFIGAVADCLFSLIEAPSITEAGKSVSLGDKSLILKKVNRLYLSIGEDEKTIDVPRVHFGWGRK